MIPYDPQPAARVTRITYAPVAWKRNGKERETVVFIGHPRAILAAIRTTNKRPRWSWLLEHLPHYVVTFISYLIAFNTAFAIINGIPALGLDGQDILHHAMHRLFPSLQWRQQAVTFTVWFLTGLLVFTLSTTLLYLLRSP
jgi:Zn-dependent protease